MEPAHMHRPAGWSVDDGYWRCILCDFRNGHGSPGPAMCHRCGTTKRDASGYRNNNAVRARMLARASAFRASMTHSLRDWEPERQCWNACMENARDCTPERLPG